MKTYVVFVRILGGDWSRCSFPDERYETLDLAEALGLAATVKDTIKETMVVGITTTTPLPPDYSFTTRQRQYELIE